MNISVFSISILLFLSFNRSLFAAKVMDHVDILQSAIIENNIEILSKYLNLAANINQLDAKGDPLFFSAKTPAMLQFLIDNGVDINAMNLQGQTILDRLLMYSPKAVKQHLAVLINAGIKIPDNLINHPLIQVLVAIKKEKETKEKEAMALLLQNKPNVTLAQEINKMLGLAF